MSISVFERIKHGLIVSCQALEEEPLHSSMIMAKMAYAAYLGGAIGIRANSAADIIEIKKAVNLPVIGLIKVVYSDSEVYITPTEAEVSTLVKVGVDIIATDATSRLRPGGVQLKNFFDIIKSRFPQQVFMADCATVEDGIFAEAIGFDCVGTTLSGYTKDTKGRDLPDLDMMQRLSRELRIPVIAEGGIWSPEQLKSCFDCGIHTAVVGSAITRPMEITKRFVTAIEKNQ